MSTTWAVLLWGAAIAAVSFVAGWFCQWASTDLSAGLDDVWPEEIL